MASIGIIVIGASAGGIEPLIQLVRQLPHDIPAAVFVVVHVQPFGTSHLPAILRRHTNLEVAHAEQGQAIRGGRIYVAPPDRHLLIRDGHVELTRGPRENRARPAVDPLFRTAARTYGPRVIGVILSGALGDGSVGLMIVKAHGGATIVQEPDEAQFAGMPRTAIQRVPVDYILPTAEMGAVIARLAREGPSSGGAAMTAVNDVEHADEVIQQDLQEQSVGERSGQTAVFSCPECGGTLWQLNEGQLVQFNCHVGHAWSSSSLLMQKSEELERGLWVCVRTLVEKATLTRQLANEARARGHEEGAVRLEAMAALDERHMKYIRESLLEAMPNPTEQAVAIEQVLETAVAADGPSARSPRSAATQSQVASGG